MHILTKHSGVITKKIDWTAIVLNAIWFLFIGAVSAYALVG